MHPQTGEIVVEFSVSYTNPEQCAQIHSARLIKDRIGNCLMLEEQILTSMTTWHEKFMPGTTHCIPLSAFRQGIWTALAGVHSNSWLLELEKNWFAFQHTCDKTQAMKHIEQLNANGTTISLLEKRMAKMLRGANSISSVPTLLEMLEENG